MKQMAIVVCFDETQIGKTDAFDALKLAGYVVDEYIAEHFPGTVMDMEDAVFVDDDWNLDEEE